MSSSKKAKCHPEREHVAHGMCKNCYDSVQYRKHFLRHRNYELKRAYGITVDEYEDLFCAQDGRCAICGVSQELLKKFLAVDHDHKSSIPETAGRNGMRAGTHKVKVRGLLCTHCNTVVGHIEKVGLENAFRAIEYLKTHGQ